MGGTGVLLKTALPTYERMEIRDAMAYFRVVVSPDDDLAFERIVNVPKRGLGDATLKTLHDLARAHGVHEAEILDQADESRGPANRRHVRQPEGERAVGSPQGLEREFFSMLNDLEASPAAVARLGRLGGPGGLLALGAVPVF